MHKAYGEVYTYPQHKPEKVCHERHKIGSGKIQYLAPYARYQYYGKLMVSSVTGSSYARHGEKKVLTDIDLVYSTFKEPLAGKLWFERMKADKKQQILRGAAAIMGGKAK